MCWKVSAKLSGCQEVVCVCFREQTKCKSRLFEVNEVSRFLNGSRLFLGTANHFSLLFRFFPFICIVLKSGAVGILNFAEF